MDINEAETVRKVLDNIKEVGGNAKRFVSLIKKQGSITKLIAYFEGQLPTKRDELANLLSNISIHQQNIVQLQDEENRHTITITLQNNQINSNNYQLNLISANIAQLERRRQALITWIGKQLNLSQGGIDYLRLSSEFEVALAAIDNGITDLIRARTRQLQRALDPPW
jgi:hypothetical protein